MMYAFDTDLSGVPVYSQAVELAAISRRGDRWAAIADKHGKVKNTNAFAWSQSSRLFRILVLSAGDMVSESFSFDPKKDALKAWADFSAAEQVHIFEVANDLIGAALEHAVLRTVAPEYINGYLNAKIEREINQRLVQARAA